MKIIKTGKPPKRGNPKVFSCKKCGCIFEASKDEYSSGTQYNETYYYCKCPCCKDYAHVYI